MANRSSHANGACDVNNLSRAGRAEFSALGDEMRAVTGICPRGARLHMLVHSVTRSLNRCTRAIAKQDDVASGASATHKFSCDVASGASATYDFSCNVAVQRPKIILDFGCARRDRVAVHAIGCGCAAAQRDARGRGVCLFLASRWLAMLASCTYGRAVPAVRSRTALRLRIDIYNAHCIAGLLAERAFLRREAKCC